MVNQLSLVRESGQIEVGFGIIWPNCLWGV